MDILEKLYTSAERHLEGDVQDWDQFSAEFRRAFCAHVALYHTAIGNDNKTVESFTVRMTSSPDTMQRYVDAKIYLHHHIPETSLAPLEPARRSDDVSDAAFRKLGPLADFLIANGMFYQLIVPAILTDGTFAGLGVWRSEDEGDFSDLEKQRLALFMRHLVAIVDEADLQLTKPTDELSQFGRKWKLTHTEVDILSALLQGLSLKAIAEQTARSYGTVRWHVQNILAKCQVSSQKELLMDFYQLIRK